MKPAVLILLITSTVHAQFSVDENNQTPEQSVATAKVRYGFYNPLQAVHIAAFQARYFASEAVYDMEPYFALAERYVDMESRYTALPPEYQELLAGDWEYVTAQIYRCHDYALDGLTELWAVEDYVTQVEELEADHWYTKAWNVMLIVYGHMYDAKDLKEASDKLIPKINDALDLIEPLLQSLEEEELVE